MTSMRQVLMGTFLLASGLLVRPDNAAAMPVPDKKPATENNLQGGKDSVVRSDKTADFKASTVDDEDFVQEQIKNGRTLKSRNVGFIVDTKDGLVFHAMDDLQGISAADLAKADSAVSYNFEEDVIQNIENKKGKVIGTETYHVKENIVLAHKRGYGGEDAKFTRDHMLYGQFQIQSPDGKVSSIVMNRTDNTGDGRKGSDPELLRGNNFWYALKGPNNPNEVAGAKTVIILMTAKQTLNGAIPTIGADPRYVVEEVIEPTVRNTRSAGNVATPDFNGNGKKLSLVGVMANHSGVMVSNNVKPGM